MSRKPYITTLASIFLIEFVVLAVAPHDRRDWALENALVLAFAVFVWVFRGKLQLSRTAWTLVFVFLALHEIGAHYTYAEVPYEPFLATRFGFSLDGLMGWQRNNFDRVVHFLFGLLLVVPLREIYARAARVSGFWSYFFPVVTLMAGSMVFELFEWAAAVVFGGDLGVAYLGTQGDVWDAQKDMAMASAGAVLAAIAAWLAAMAHRARGQAQP